MANYSRFYGEVVFYNKNIKNTEKIVCGSKNFSLIL